MKKHISVFMLMARSTICKVIGLFAILALAEVGMFLYVLNMGSINGSFSLELMVEHSCIAWAFGAVFLLLTVLLCHTGTETKSKTGYTLMRLSISERWIFFWQSLYNALCYLMLWLVQILIAVLLCRLFEVLAAPEHVTSQTVFLAFYRSNFFHSLLPFEDTAFWVRNVILVLALGICAARYPLGQRHGSKLQEIHAISAYTFGYFVREIGDASCIVAIIVALIGAGTSIWRAFDMNEEAKHEEA